MSLAFPCEGLKHERILSLPDDAPVVDICAICMQPAGTEGTVDYLPSCSHPFCGPCLKRWADHCHRKQNDVTCPTCRRITVDLTA